MQVSPKPSLHADTSMSLLGLQAVPGCPIPARGWEHLSLTCPLSGEVRRGSVGASEAGYLQEVLNARGQPQEREIVGVWPHRDVPLHWKALAVELQVEPVHITSSRVPEGRESQRASSVGEGHTGRSQGV